MEAEVRCTAFRGHNHSCLHSAGFCLCWWSLAYLAHRPAAPLTITCICHKSMLAPCQPSRPGHEIKG